MRQGRRGQDWWDAVVGCFDHLIKLVGDLGEDVPKTLCILALGTILALFATAIGVLSLDTSRGGIYPLQFVLVFTCIILLGFVFLGCLVFLVVLVTRSRARDGADGRGIATEDGRAKVPPSPTNGRHTQNGHHGFAGPEGVQEQEAIEANSGPAGGGPASTGGGPEVTQAHPHPFDTGGARLVHVDLGPALNRLLFLKWVELKSLLCLLHRRRLEQGKLSREFLRGAALGIVSQVHDDLAEMSTLGGVTERIRSLREELVTELGLQPGSEKKGARRQADELAEKVIRIVSECIATIKGAGSEFN